MAVKIGRVLTAAQKRAGIVKFYRERGEGQYECEVLLEKMIIPTYQRPVVAKHRIINQFDPRLAMPILGSFRGGKVNVIDGQQRRNSLISREVETFDCLISTDYTLQTEAEKFLSCNTSPQKVAGWDCYKAAIIANIYVYVALNRLFDKYKLSTPMDPGVKKNAADVTAIECFLTPAKKEGGLARVENILFIITKSFQRRGVLTQGATETAFVRGLFDAYGSAGLAREEMVKALKGWTVENIRKLAETKTTKSRTDAPQFKQAFEEIALPKKYKLVA